MQQRIAELTAEAEENVSGIRIVKAFAREEHQLHRFQRAVARVFDQSIYSTRLQAFFSPLIGFLPQLGIALVLLVGGRQVIDGNLSLGSFTAFYTYIVMLAAPMRMLGMAMGMAQRAIASGNRLFESSTASRASSARQDAPALPGRRRPGRAPRRHPPLRGRRRSRCRLSTQGVPKVDSGAGGTSTSTSRPGARSPWSGRRARGRRAWWR